MVDSKLAEVIAEALNGWEEEILRSFALAAILAQSGMSASQIDDAVHKVLAQPDVQREAKKMLFGYRAIRENLEEYLRVQHGAVLPPQQKPN